jgi:hypothetical protein
MTNIKKIGLLILLVLFLGIFFYNREIQKQNDKILSEKNISDTGNLEHIVANFNFTPPDATRLYAFALWYRDEGVKARTGFLKKLVLEENYTFWFFTHGWLVYI